LDAVTLDVGAGAVSGRLADHRDNLPSASVSWKAIESAALRLCL
jgi:hypothetical protein